MLRLIVVLVSASLTFSSAQAGVITIGGSLGTPVVNTANQTVRFDVTAKFRANPGAPFESGFFAGFAIDVSQSLVNGVGIPEASLGSFSFDAASTFSSWTTVSEFGATDSTTIPVPVTWGPSTIRIEAPTIPDEISITDSIDLNLGVLEFDYSTFGLIGGDSFIIDIKGDINLIPTSASFVPNDFGLPVEWIQPLDFESQPEFGPAAQSVTLPIESGVVPEPTSIAIWGLLGLGVVGARRRKLKSA